MAFLHSLHQLPLPMLTKVFAFRFSLKSQVKFVGGTATGTVFSAR
jgi:hypothetical protein